MLDGGLLWGLSPNVVRYVNTIRYQAAAMLLLSSTGIAIARVAGVPMRWAIVDAVGCWLFCLPTLVLSWNLAVHGATSPDTD